VACSTDAAPVVPAGSKRRSASITAKKWAARPSDQTMSQALTFVASVALVAMAATAAQAHTHADNGDDGDKAAKGAAAPASWILGDSNPRAGAVLEAWFDRGAAPGADPHYEVVVGSPSDLAVWLRTGTQTCRDTEQAARGKTTPDDGGLLYVCVRLRHPGKFRLAAAAGQRSPIVSDPIEVVSEEIVSPAVAAAITTLVAFLLGIGTTVFQGWFQTKQEKDRVQHQARKTLAEVLTREILENQQRLQAVVDGTTTPEFLVSSAYNNETALGPIAWGYLQGAGTSYRQKIDDLYSVKMLPYKKAMHAWDVAATAEQKAAALDKVRTAATVLLKDLHAHKE
jgi:hypothetical protein